MHPETKQALLLQASLGMLDFQRAVALCHFVMQCNDIPGAIVELGCHAGYTAAMLASVTKKQVWLYDCFEGLPEPGPFDANKSPFTKGAMSVAPSVARHLFAHHELPEPTIKVGKFAELDADDLPAYIALAHVDCDLYQSTLDALNAVYPHLSIGAMCIIDDLTHPELPGVRRAVEVFLKERPEKLFAPKGIRGDTSLHGWFVKANPQ